MFLLIDLSLMAMLVVLAIALVKMRSLFAVIMMSSIYSLVSAGFFMNLDAGDVALTEAAVGAGISTVLMLAALSLTRGTEKPTTRSRAIPLVAVLVTGATLIYGTLDMPHFSTADAPVHQHVAPRYIQQSAEEIGVPNMITSILASYRGFDTFGEVAVVFCAGLGVLSLLGSFRAPGVKSDSTSLIEDMILRVMTKALFPLILLFALYVQFHGDYGPGGGFQAGVLFAVAFVLYTIVFGLDKAQRVVPPPVLHILMALGVLIFGSVGVVTMLAGGQFLDYNMLSSDPVAGQHLGILLVELGVGITVSAVMLSIYFDFSRRVSERYGARE
jgi:multicomponent Na+:H+ antiporter subunit B